MSICSDSAERTTNQKSEMTYSGCRVFSTDLVPADPGWFGGRTDLMPAHPGWPGGAHPGWPEGRTDLVPARPGWHGGRTDLVPDHPGWPEGRTDLVPGWPGGRVVVVKRVCCLLFILLLLLYWKLYPCVDQCVVCYLGNVMWLQLVFVAMQVSHSET